MLEVRDCGIRDVCPCRSLLCNSRRTRPSRDRLDQALPANRLAESSGVLRGDVTGRCREPRTSRHRLPGCFVPIDVRLESSGSVETFCRRGARPTEPRQAICDGGRMTPDANPGRVKTTSDIDQGEGRIVQRSGHSRGRRRKAAAALLLFFGAVLTVGVLRITVARSARSAALALGSPLPPVSLENVAGQPVNLLEVAPGHRRVVVFYAPTCGRCERDLPAIQPFPPGWTSWRSARTPTPGPPSSCRRTDRNGICWIPAARSAECSRRPACRRSSSSTGRES